ncbi:hypothetical protein J7E90_30400 [Streptomyces sp. ISL-111]|uniref:hypothetical protein n=1 Tax=unclassified Streptomyces TaxID=2593676 RepID=UPI001BEB6AFB|nr:MULTISPECIES: hypothetical protein [unclassified Streptomyces]MBT2381492.1 hypothetical protein [Streptomyces sp. ISL-111]MBT2424829.1 hypothetical protein [Streptomyces sp. ISL-112]MBT2463884.1 hypothetical protein [Streptomyces sp. ISL-63]
MNRIAMRTAPPLITAGAVLLAGAGSGAAATADEPGPADGAKIVLNHGRVVGDDDTLTFTFEGEKPKTSKGEFSAMACPEVNDRPEYTVKGSPHFMPDKRKPQSTWLLPRQTVSWAVSGSHTFT